MRTFVTAITGMLALTAIATAQDLKPSKDVQDAWVVCQRHMPAGSAGRHVYEAGYEGCRKVFQKYYAPELAAEKERQAQRVKEEQEFINKVGK